MLILQRENEASECLTTVYQLVTIVTNKHVTSLKEDSLKHSHDIVNFEIVKQARNRFVIDIGELVEARHAKFYNLIFACVVYIFGVWQIKL